MTIESLSKRIKTTQDLREIVTTMKALSSVSILQYEQAQKSLIEYTHTIKKAFHAMIRNRSLQISRPKSEPKELKTVIILIGSDNGLVGRFNKELVQHVMLFCANKKIDIKQTSFISIGKRMAGIIEQNKIQAIAQYPISNSIKTINNIASSVIIKMQQILERTKAEQAIVFFHKRFSGQPVQIEHLFLLPFQFQMYKDLQAEPWPTNNVPFMTLKPKVMLSKLIQEYLMISLLSAITMSLAAEHYTRMINMQSAEKNIDENLELLNIEFQQKRQESITEELIDVISGSEALKLDNKKNYKKT